MAFFQIIDLRANGNPTMGVKKTQLPPLMALSLGLIWLSLSIGSTPLHWQAVWTLPQSQDHLIFFDLRLPRTLAAFTTGGLLALAGCFMQSLLENPLADPYVLGLSSGAAVGALLAAMISTSVIALQAGAWAGSLFTIFLLLSLVGRRRFHAQTLLLMGVALASGLSALASLLLMLQTAEHVRPLLFWLAGDLSGASVSWFAIVVLFVCLILGLVFANGLNVLNRGENIARTLGLPVRRYRIGLYLGSALLTATAVTQAGCVGFVGLIIPHLIRRFLSCQSQTLLPAAVLAGGGLLTLADTLARTVVTPLQCPVGICMTLIGVPFLIAMLRP